MPSQTDLYELLGVSQNATQEEIRKAYLKLAHKYHPDKTGGDKNAEEKLKKINAAYDILKNPEKRKQYDQFGSMDGQPFQGGFGPGFGGDFSSGFDSSFGDIFDMLFGQGGRQRGTRTQPGHDLEYELVLKLGEVAHPHKKTISFQRHETCSECGGAGAMKGTQPESCPQCHGTGQVRQSHGVFSMSRPCNRCGGAGRIIAHPCTTCKGSGQVQRKRELNIDIPAGVESGTRLRVSGEGEAGRLGGPHGDLYIRIRVLEHEFFERHGIDIVCEAPITLTQAALGATIRVPTLNGQADLKVPAGTQSGTQLRLRGHGLSDLRGYRQGDQIVVIEVETPVKLSRRQRELLEEFESLSNNRTYPVLDEFKAKTDSMKKH